MSGAATIIITTIPPRRQSVNTLADECVALANDVLAEMLGADLDKLAFAVQGGDWPEVDAQINALGVSRPYTQLS